MLAAGEYTFSVFLQLLSDTSGSVNDTGVFLRITDTADNILAESERLTKAESAFILPVDQGLDLYQREGVCLCKRPAA